MKRACTSRLRLDDKGEVVSWTPQTSLINKKLTTLLQSDEVFVELLKPLLGGSFVRRDRSGTTIAVHQLVYQVMSVEERLEWTKITIRLVSHSFLEEASLDEPYEALRSALTPHVCRCVDHAQKYKTEDLDDVLGHLISMFLSPLGRSGKEPWLLDYIDPLLKEKSNVYYRSLAAKWRAYM